MGNVGSIQNMLSRIGARSVITSDPDEVDIASHLILPGVGAFDNAMARLRTLELIDALSRSVLVRKVPLLGICLGMQLLTRGSEEGTLAGLGWIDAHTRRFNFGDTPGPPVPHMAWNTVRMEMPRHLISSQAEDARFYFAHSFYVDCASSDDVVGTTTYGGIRFASVVQRDNISGVQFHPEKSHRYGMTLLGSFSGL